MKKQIPIYFLIFSAIIAGCSNNKKKIIPAKSNKPRPISITIDTSKILLSQTYLHAFSDNVKKDTFKLVIEGKSIVDGKIKFEIISFKNEKIYSENYDAVDLLGDLDGLSAKQKEDTIRIRFKGFFNADDFGAPAIGHKVDLTDTDYVDLRTQKDISSDTTAIGFTYSIGYESTFEIAYSKRNKKTVVCFASD